jgi:small subunit ribosomal protein S14
MKRFKKRDISSRLNYFKKIKKKIILKSIFYNQSIKFEIKEKLFYKKKNTVSINKLSNTCLITQRSNSILKKFKMSRITFRALAHKGLIPGVTKSS